MQRYIVLIIIIFTCLSCGKKSPVDPGATEFDRTVSDFGVPTNIFPGVGVGIFYDADISEIVQGPGLLDSNQWGTLWHDINGKHWAVAVALREDGVAQNGNRKICYRFLNEDGVVSPVFNTPVADGIIRLPASLC
ncbi:MAG: hypothetical protein NTY09_13500 [bacterium]|nr:hypothetical protein [bacterium]